MVQVITELDGKKYKLVPDCKDGCDKCALANIAPECYKVDMTYNEQMCVKYNGIWKEVGDDKNNK